MHSPRRIVHRVATRAAEVDVFFLGGAVAFSVLLAGVPFLFLLLGIAGFLLPNLDTQALVGLLMAEVPQSTGSIDPTALVGGLIDGVVRDRTGISVLGTLLFVWFSTRLVGSLRAVLRAVFAVEDGHGVVLGFLFDIVVVILATFMLTLNLAVTVLVKGMGSEGARLLGLESTALSTFDALLVRATGFALIWVLCLLIYRMVTERPIAWKTAAIAATFLAVAHELLKFAFSWYVTSVATYRSVYGNLATVAVTLFWLYYTTTAFVVGGLFAEAVTQENKGQ